MDLTFAVRLPLSTLGAATDRPTAVVKACLPFWIFVVGQKG